MEQMNITKDSIIGEVVARDYRTAEIFSRHRIDFCCQGGRTIEEACEKKKINAGQLLTELNALHTSVTSEFINYNAWPLDLLADYIEKKHHRYVAEKTQTITRYLTKISQVHGDAHPELREIATLFLAGAQELAAHMKKEELILFPFIRKMVTSGSATASFGSVSNPISMMKHEHDLEGERFRRIAELSNNYTPPPEACNTYRVTYALLHEFEQDLHLHIHLENNILFPKVIELEKKINPKTLAN